MLVPNSSVMRRALTTVTAFPFRGSKMYRSLFDRSLRFDAIDHLSF